MKSTTSLLACVLVLSLVLPIFAVDKKPKKPTKAQIEAQEKARKNAEAEAAKEEAEVIENAAAKYDDLKQEYRQAAIDNYKAQLEQLKKNGHSIFLPKNGKSILYIVFGQDQSSKIMAVLNNEGPIYPSLISGSRADLDIGKWGTVARVKVVQVVSESKIHCQFEKLTCFIDGIDTKNMVDDKTYDLQGLFVVNGTETYKAVSGASRKVFVVSKFDPRKDPAEQTK